MGELLRKNAVGNLSHALKNGMSLHVLQSGEDRKASAIEYANKFKDALFIPEGVACELAEAGFRLQAAQIEEFCAVRWLEPAIFLPSGTGTSAAYLAKHTRLKVYTCACVGDGEYLRAQIVSLLGFLPANYAC